MNWVNLTDRCIEAMLLAQQEAKFLSDPHVGTEHLLIGLVAGGKTVGAQLLASMGVDQAVLRAYLAAMKRPMRERGLRPEFSERAQKAVLLALEEANQGGNPFVSTDHLFVGLLLQEESTACAILRELGVAIEPLVEKLRQESRPAVFAAEPVPVPGDIVMGVLDGLQGGLERFLAALLERLVQAEWDVRWPALDREDEVRPWEAEDYPVSSLVQMILSRGITVHAAQILLEPQDSSLAIRYVFDNGGSELVEAPKVLKDVLPFNVMRLACLNPLEKGRELQGEMVFALRGRDHRLRVHSEPIHKGVKLRIQVENRAA